MNKIYGYCRISTKKQKIERQIENIKKREPDAVIISEAYTGTKVANRPAWSKLFKAVNDGDTIIFDEVSRMARNAEDGFAAYKELYERGVNLVFLKESALNTDNFRQTAQIAMTGTEVDCILEGINKYLMILAEKQIFSAFQTAQHEVDFLHQRTSEGVRRAQAMGKRVGTEEGRKLNVKKSAQAKEVIRKHSKSFDGTLTDAEVMKLANISINTLYKYKREMRAEEES